MNQGLKKISTLLLLALAFSPVIFHFMLQVQQRSIQHRMKERLEEDKVHTLTLDKAALHWVKPGKEILVDGQMFDLKSITDKGNGILVITGLFDHEETQLVEQLKKKQQEDASKGNKLLVQAFQLILALPEHPFTEQLTPYRVSSCWSSLENDVLSSPFLPILTPPPQV